MKIQGTLDPEWLRLYRVAVANRAVSKETAKKNIQGYHTCVGVVPERKGIRHRLRVARRRRAMEWQGSGITGLCLRSVGPSRARLLEKCLW